jgi:hypothetical protein
MIQLANKRVSQLIEVKKYEVPLPDLSNDSILNIQEGDDLKSPTRPSKPQYELDMMQ